MIRINLLPVRAIDQVSSRRKELGLVGSIFVLTFLSILIVQVLQSSQLTEAGETSDRLERELTKIRKENKDLEKLEQQKKELEEKIRVVNALTAPQRRTAPVHVLDDLSSSSPQFLWLTEYTENRGAAQIRGKAIDNQTIALFANNLANSPYFRNVEIRETQQEAQVVAVRGRSGRSAARETETPSSVMMTKFLLEAAINYGLPVETANNEEGEASQSKKGVTKKTPTQAATAASASTPDKE
ncbi:MAG: PilN domain-containing protein [Candidatus Binatia bacterium]